MATSSPAGVEPTQDERTLAALAQGLSIFGFIPPLVIFLIKRQSRFVSFHALQALLWHIAWMIVIFAVIISFVVVIMVTVVGQSASRGTTPPLGIFIAFPLLWLILIAGGIGNMILAIVYAIKAGQGEWADYPIFGNLARKMLHMGPR